jgi:2,3-bisphosphoglycerate-dependent phosphoglycerate mutase
MGTPASVPPTELIAVRHGESEGNVAREAAEAEQAELITIDQRDPDVPLSPRGRTQAEAVGRWLGEYASGAPLAAAWSSPYVRARQTAELALGVAQVALPVRVDERLRDRELGILDLLTSRGVTARYPAEADRRRWLGKLYYRPPGGESWADVALRLRSFLLDLERQEVTGPVVVFCHDAVIMLLRYVLEGLEEGELLDLARTTSVANGSVTRIVATDSGWTIAEFNDVQHLHAAGAPATRHEGETDDVRP